MRISIVISVLNGAATLERCLDSIAGQTWPEREVVVMDGGSSDGTVDILARRAAELAHWKSEPDRGIYHAWNKALRQVTGEWVLFLGADDTLRSPDALERMASDLRDDGGRTGIVYGSVDVVAPDGRRLATVGRPWEAASDDFRHRMAIPHQATFHHASFFERHGPFDERFRICGDYELLLRALARPGAAARFVPDVVVVAMQAGGLSDRPASLVTMAREFALARWLHGLAPVPPALAPAVWRARARFAIGRLLGAQAADAAARGYRVLAGRDRDGSPD